MEISFSNCLQYSCTSRFSSSVIDKSNELHATSVLELITSSIAMKNNDADQSNATTLTPFSYQFFSNLYSYTTKQILHTQFTFSFMRKNCFPLIPRARIICRGNISMHIEKHSRYVRTPIHLSYWAIARCIRYFIFGSWINGHLQPKYNGSETLQPGNECHQDCIKSCTYLHRSLLLLHRCQNFGIGSPTEEGEFEKMLGNNVTDPTDHSQYFHRIFLLQGPALGNYGIL